MANFWKSKKINIAFTISLFIVLCIINLLKTSVYALDLGQQSPPFMASKWLYGKEIPSLDYISGNVFIVATWDPSTTISPIVIDRLNYLHNKYKNCGFKIISFASSAPAGELLQNHPIEHASFIDNNDQTYDLFVSERSRFPVYAFIFDSDKNLIWEGYSLDYTEKIACMLSLKKIDLQIVLDNKKYLGEFSKKMRGWIRNRYEFDIVLPELNEIYKERLNNASWLEVSRLIIATYIDGRKIELPALIEYWIDSLTRSNIDIEKEVLDSCKWIADIGDGHRYLKKKYFFTKDRDTLVFLKTYSMLGSIAFLANGLCSIGDMAAADEMLNKIKKIDVEKYTSIGDESNRDIKWVRSEVIKNIMSNMNSCARYEPMYNFIQGIGCFN